MNGGTWNASTVLVLVKRHKLEQDAATGMQLALGQNMVHIVPSCAHLRASLPLAGLCTNNPITICLTNVNVEVGGDGALIRKVVDVPGVSEEMQGAHTLELCVVSIAITMHVICNHS